MMTEKINMNEENKSGEGTERKLEVVGKIKGEEKKKRGRRKKNEPVEQEINKDQNKYYVDVTKDSEGKELLLNLLAQANKKDFGREITFRDLVFAALPKLSPKDIEKIQESTLTEMEKVQRALNDYNKKNETNLSLGEFLVRKLGIN